MAKIRHLYTNVICSMIMYGVLVWARFLNKKNTAILTRLQRLMAIRAIRTHRTTPTDVALLLAGMVLFTSVAKTEALVYRKAVRRK